MRAYKRWRPRTYRVPSVACRTNIRACVQPLRLVPYTVKFVPIKRRKVFLKAYDRSTYTSGTELSLCWSRAGCRMANPQVAASKEHALAITRDYISQPRLSKFCSRPRMSCSLLPLLTIMHTTYTHLTHSLQDSSWCEWSSCYSRSSEGECLTCCHATWTLCAYMSFYLCNFFFITCNSCS